MTLTELIEKVDKYYDDGLILAYYDPETKSARDDRDIGDGLARFIVEEICETFEPYNTDEEQLLEAVRVLTTAVHQLGRIIDGLEA